MFAVSGAISHCKLIVEPESGSNAGSMTSVTSQSLTAFRLRATSDQAGHFTKGRSGFILLNEDLSLCLLLLKNRDKTCAFGVLYGKIGDFKSFESENDKPLR